MPLFALGSVGYLWRAGQASDARRDVASAAGGFELAGRVRVAGAGPARGARVNVVCRDGARVSADLNALTDDEGAFHFPAVPAGDVTVCAFHTGFRGARLALGRLDAERRDLELVLTLGSTIGGRVSDARKAPVARASLWIESWSDRRGNGEVLSGDADGRFRASALDDGPFRVTAWDELGSGGAIAVAFRVPAETLDLELRLAPPATLLLVLRGEPSSDGVVAHLLDLDGWELAPAPRSNDDRRPRWTARADDEGIVLSGLAPGEYWAEAQDLERRRAGWTRVTVPAGERVRSTLVLTTATWLRVRANAEHTPLVVRGADGFAKRLDPDPGASADTSANRVSALLPIGSYRIEGVPGGAPVVLSGEPEVVVDLAAR